MTPYSDPVCQSMKRFYDSLSEKDKRRYAAVEAAKLGYGGTAYIAKLLEVDEKTIRSGRADLEILPEDPAGPRVRKKGRPIATC